MKRIVIFILYLGFVTMMFAPKAEVFNPQTMTLKNGLQVVVVSNPISPIVSVAILYKVGTADDPQSMVGLSHFLEHMMFKGTKVVSGDEFKSAILSKGGLFNAGTGNDYTFYYTNIGVAHLELALKLEADRMQNLVFDDKVIEDERQVVLEERRMNYENSPFGLAAEVTQQALFWYHPYRTLAIGFPHHIKAYTKEALERHYNEWYGPNNAILFIAGDVKLEVVLPLIEKYFQDIPARGNPKRQRVAEPDHKGVSMKISTKNPRISLTGLTWFFTAPNHRTASQEDFYALIVLEQVLAGSEISRLYRVLVEEKHLAVSVRSQYPGTTFDPQPFYLEVVLAPNVDAKTLEDAVFTEIKKILEEGVSEEELNDAKRDLLAGLVFVKDGIHSILEFFQPLATDFSVQSLESYPEKVEGVTRQQVQKAAQLVLGKEPILEVTVLPEKEKESGTS